MHAVQRVADGRASLDSVPADRYTHVTHNPIPYKRDPV